MASGTTNASVIQPRIRSRTRLSSEMAAASVFCLSMDYDTVLLGRVSDRARQHATIDAAGNAMLNLPY